MPESFEWLILRSAIFDRNDNVQEILADPAEHIDCEKYFSWERFFTALLVAETNGRANLEYHENKSHIPSGYLSEQNIYSILNAMKNSNRQAILCADLIAQGVACFLCDPACFPHRKMV